MKEVFLFYKVTKENVKGMKANLLIETSSCHFFGSFINHCTNKPFYYAPTVFCLLFFVVHQTGSKSKKSLLHSSVCTHRFSYETLMCFYTSCPIAIFTSNKVNVTRIVLFGNKIHTDLNVVCLLSLSLLMCVSANSCARDLSLYVLFLIF